MVLDASLPDPELGYVRRTLRDVDTVGIVVVIALHRLGRASDLPERVCKRVKGLLVLRQEIHDMLEVGKGRIGRFEDMVHCFRVISPRNHEGQP